MSKRPSNAIWKIKDAKGKSPSDLLQAIVSNYEKRVKEEPGKYTDLVPVLLKDDDANKRLKLYIRKRFTQGFYGYVGPILDSSVDKSQFSSYPKDACLFIMTEKSLYVITSGSGYHIIENHVDYSFPFDVAKKVISNGFKSAQKRKLNGATLDVNEKYRREYQIDKSESFGTIWKNLVGTIDYDVLPSGSYLKSLLNPDRPSTADIKSSFTIKKNLGLNEVIKLIDDVESLGEPSDEHKRAMEFLDCLQPVKKSPSPKELDAGLVEFTRTEFERNQIPDFDVFDPKEIDRYYQGSDYKLDKIDLSEDRPESEHVLRKLAELSRDYLTDQEEFAKFVNKIQLKYVTGDTEEVIAIPILKTVNGQLEFDGQTYFKIDGDWYRGQGDYLKVLKNDFIRAVFEEDDCTLTTSLELPDWLKSHKEADFNRAASKQDNWYFGDKIFLKQKGRGKIELFDLLYVDNKNKRTYIVHSKDDFDAKMRDVCSQLETSRDVIEASVNSDKLDLGVYYDEWVKDLDNSASGVDKDTFVSWFEYERVYVAICSTKTDFDRDTFEKDQLGSHIARREVLISKQDFKGRAVKFYLAHAKKVDR